MQMSIRAWFLLGAGSMIAAVMMESTPAYAQQRFDLDIPQQNLGSALRAFGRATHQQVFFDGALVRGRRSAALKGSFAAQDALERLLAGSGLTVQTGERGIFLVRPASSSAAPRPAAVRLLSPATVEADSPTEPSEQEIIVTAQKYEQRLIDVPMSINAISGQELQDRQIRNIEDLASAVPGMTFASDGQSTRIQLRGISNLTGNQSLVGIYLDEVPVTSAAYSQLELRTYDLERVEVLKGPQGTLYGEGSVGGTVRFISRDPRLDRLALSGDATTMFTHDGASSQRLDAMLNVPVSSTLGVRVVGTFDHLGGWIDQPAANRKNFNDQNLAHVRAKLLWQPTADFTVKLMAVIHRNDAPRNATEDADGNFKQVFNLTTTPHVDNDYDLYNATLTYDFGKMRLLNSSSYIDQTIRSYDYPGFLQLAPPPAIRYNFLSPYDRRDVAMFTNELRLSSDGIGPAQWTIGGFYRHFKFYEISPQNYFGLPGPVGTPLPPPYAFDDGRKSESWAVFADLNYQIAPRLLLGAGLRYFEDRQATTTGASQSGTFDAWSPRFYAQYSAARNFNLYASVGKGFRSGGFNLAGQPPFDPETVWTYEAGAKFAARKTGLRGEASIFRSNYQGYQIFGTVPLPTPFAITSNAGDARIDGIEGSLSWRGQGWELSLSGAVYDTGFRRIRATATSHIVGDPLDLFPKYSFSAAIQREFSVGERDGFIRVDYNQQGRETYRNRNLAGPTPFYFGRSGIINLLNFTSNIQLSEQVSAGLFVLNLLNDRDFTDPRDIEGAAPRSRARTFGFQVGFKL